MPQSAAIGAPARAGRRLGIGDNHVVAENAAGQRVGRLAVIDIATTGLKRDLGDRIIDLAIATCEYGLESGRLHRVIGMVDTDMHATPGLDVKLRSRLVPGPGGQPPPEDA